MALTVPVHELVASSRNPLLAIPSHWSRARLGDVGEVLNGFAFKSAQFSRQGGMPLVRIRDVGRETTDTNYVGEYDARYVVRAGDLLVGMDGDFNCARWRGADALLNQRVCRVSVDPTFYEPRLLDYVLPAYLHAINEATSSVTVKHLSARSVEDIPLPLPPMDEQREIVAEIEKQFSRLDEAVANLHRVKTKLKQFRRGVLSNAVQGWAVTTLGSLLREPLRNGHSAKGTDDPAGLRAFTLTAVTVGDFSERNTKRTVATAKKVADLWAQPGDIFVERSNTPELVGTSRLYRGPANFAFIPDLLIRVRVSEAVTPEYAEIVLQSDAARRFFRSRAQGIAGSMPKIDQDTVAALPLPLPTHEDQHRIVAEVDRRLSTARAVEAEVDANLKRAQALRQAVLQRAFSGRLVAGAKACAVRSVLKLIPGSASPTDTARVVLSAEIVHRLHDQPTFGRVKHQKIFHLIEHIARIESIQGVYERAAAGPLDLPMIETNVGRMEALGWYAERQRETGGPHAYLALSKAGEHAPYLGCFTDGQLATIRKLIDLMRDWKTDRCEMVSTAYAAWNDLLLFGIEPTPEAIVSEVLEKWNDKKRRFGRAEWLQQVAWIKQHGFEPSGFGRPTRGRADGLTPDLFDSASR